MTMKKIISILLLLSLALSLTACTSFEAKEISCEEIIAAYEEAGYSVLYHGHENDENYHDLGMYCCFEIRDPNNENNIRLWKIAVSHWMPLPEKPVKEN